MTDISKMNTNNYEIVSQAFTYENIIKYDEVLKQLQYIFRQKIVKEVNAWANKELNAGISIRDRRNSI